MTSVQAPIPFAGSELREGRHVCAFFHSDEESDRVLLPFIKDGFERGEKAVHIVNPERYDDHVAKLAALGIDADATRRAGQLELRTNVETYLSDGRFDPDRMLASFEALADDRARSPYPSSRIVCHMDWACAETVQAEELIAFESRVNAVWRRHDDAVICVYDLAKFGGETVLDLVRTHPLVIVGGILQQNPFYAPPEEFLLELRARRGSPKTPPPGA